jgi:CRP-like cAMP-binding protein/di/tricarboxylate transporter
MSESAASESREAAEALATVPVFAALTPIDRAKLAAFLEDRWLDAGEVVFEAGGAGDALYVLRAGAAERRVAGSPIGAIQPPEIFGELALLTDEPRSASVIALTPLRLWVLPRARFRQLLRGEPELMFHLSAAIGQQLARARLALGELQGELDTWVATLIGALSPEDRELVEASALFERPAVAALARLMRADAAHVTGRLVDLARRSPLIQQGDPTIVVPAAIRASILRRLRAERRDRPLSARLLAVAQGLERAGDPAAAEAYMAARAPDEACRALIGMPAADKTARRATDERVGAGAQAREVSGTWGAADGRRASGRERDGAAAGSGPPRVRGPLIGRKGAWILVALLPFLAWGVPPPTGLELAGWRALLTLASAAVLFASDVLPDAVVALALLTVWVVTGLVSPRMALDGFASEAWLLVLAVLAVGVAVGNTGLLYRAALAALGRTPAGFAWRCTTLALVGVAVTPTLPNATSRMALAAPLVRELAEALGYEPGGRAASGLGLAALVGFGQMSALFLTGSSVGLLVHGLLPLEVRQQFGFGGWFVAALPLHVVLMILALAAVVGLYRPGGALPDAGDRLDLQRAVLGPMRRDEVLCVVVLLALIAGLLTEPRHGVNGAWLGVGALVALAAGGRLDAGMLRSGVNWTFLVFFGVITSLAGVFRALGIDAWLVRILAEPSRALAGSAPAFCLALALTGFALAFLVRWQAAAPLLTLVALPAADPAGVHPFLVALIALVATQVWFLPYQSTVYLALYHGSGELLSHRGARRLALLWGPLVLASILAASPVWRAMGLLR